MGKVGERINAYWGAETRTYPGIAVSRFPGLFLIYRPTTGELIVD